MGCVCGCGAVAGVGGRLSPDHHCREFMAMRSQGHAIAQGFTATGFNRNSLKVFLSVSL